MSGDDAASQLRKAASEFLEWGDSDSSGEEIEAWRRSIGLLRMSEYVHALADFAKQLGADAKSLEPARRIALSLHDAGNGFATPLFRHEGAIKEIAEIRWGGRKSPSRLAMEGRAVGCVAFLIEIGWPVKKACVHVAAIFDLARHKGRKGGRLSSKTVRGWFDSMVVSSAADAYTKEHGGWAEAKGIAELTRLNEALETTNRFLLLQAKGGKLGQRYINHEIMVLAHSCSAEPYGGLLDVISQ